MNFSVVDLLYNYVKEKSDGLVAKQFKVTFLKDQPFNQQSRTDMEHLYDELVLLLESNSLSQKISDELESYFELLRNYIMS